MNDKMKRFLPFILTLALVAVDQISKALVIKYIPLNQVGASFFNDFILIWHVRNTGAAFSLGAGGSVFLRVLFFVILPLVLMIAICYMILSMSVPKPPPAIPARNHLWASVSWIFFDTIM